MSISISIHVDGYYGLTEGVPKLLNLFDKYKIKASFFVNMGREAHLLEILRYKKNTTQKEGIIKRYSLKELVKILILNRKIGSGNFSILREIKRKGHEVNPHCWSHLKWSQNFKKINQLEELKKIEKSYLKCFHSPPKGFVAPTWKWNQKTINLLKKLKYNYLATDNQFATPFLKEELLIIPLSFKSTPEELLNKGFSEKEILCLYEKEIKKDYVNLYFHADYEGRKGIDLFEKILKLIEKNNTILYKDILQRN